MEAVTGTFSQITNSSAIIPLTARVIRMWVNKWGDTEMILFDMERNKMEAFISNWCPGAWGKRIHEGKTYTFNNYDVIPPKVGSYNATNNKFKMHFNKGIQVKEVQDCGIPRYGFSIHTVEQINSQTTTTTCLIDFIGFITRIIKVHRANKDCITFEMGDIQGMKIEVVLFEEYVDQITEICRKNDTEPAVILFAGLQIIERYGTQGRKRSLQQAFSKTSLIMSDDVPEVADFKTRMLAANGDVLCPTSSLTTFTETSFEDKFLDESLIRGVDFFMFGPEIGQYIVKAKIDGLESSRDFVWYYETCPIHTTALTDKKQTQDELQTVRYPSLTGPDDELLLTKSEGKIEQRMNEGTDGNSLPVEGLGKELVVVSSQTEMVTYSTIKCEDQAVVPSLKFYCKDCDKEVTHVTQRYKVQVCVYDGNGIASLVMWGRDVQNIIDKPCPIIKTRQQQRNRLLQHPEELKCLIGREYLFRVAVTEFNKNKKKSAYSIKAMTNTDSVIKKFNALQNDSLSYSGALTEINSEVGSNQKATPSDKRKSDELDGDKACNHSADQASEVRSHNKKRFVKMEKLE